MVEEVSREKRFLCSRTKAISTKIYVIYLINYGVSYDKLTRGVDIGNKLESTGRCN